MTERLDLSEIYDKKINFLFGAGASFGLFPTLALEIKDDDGTRETIETLATKFKGNKSAHTLLFMYYYKECIEPALLFRPDQTEGNETKQRVVENYEKFLSTVLLLLQKKPVRKRCNLFTTNYDGCFVQIADTILKSHEFDFVINDGASGFQKRYIQAKNYSNFVYQSGVFEKHRNEVPQLNLIPLHGSVYWMKENEGIRTRYEEDFTNGRTINFGGEDQLESFAEYLKDKSKTVSELTDALEGMTLDEEVISEFWDQYNKLPIVNPTKWKFHETVFEEHYYQMMRLMSYELEASDTVFITFGFSFADEHILRLVKRSLSNPSLQLFICCFNKAEAEYMNELFKPYLNVKTISLETNLDFTVFNDQVFKFKPDEERQAGEAE